VLARRAAARQHEPGRVSDAGPAVAAQQVAEWEPLTEPRHVLVATDGEPEVAVETAAVALERTL
jgi:predicted kinase